MRISVNSTARTFTWIPDDHTPQPEEKIWDSGYSETVLKLIKAEAQRRIIIVTGGGEYWREKQSNMTARFAELKDIEDERELTLTESFEKSYLKQTWAKIRAIREYSNALEFSFLSGSNISLDSVWPE
jgi:hypothetical protein